MQNIVENSNLLCIVNVLKELHRPLDLYKLLVYYNCFEYYEYFECRVPIIRQWRRVYEMMRRNKIKRVGDVFCCSILSHSVSAMRYLYDHAMPQYSDVEKSCQEMVCKLLDTRHYADYEVIRLLKKNTVFEHFLDKHSPRDNQWQSLKHLIHYCVVADRVSVIEYLVNQNPNLKSLLKDMCYYSFLIGRSDCHSYFSKMFYTVDYHYGMYEKFFLFINPRINFEKHFDSTKALHYITRHNRRDLLFVK